MMISGPRRTGKTSLLNRMQENMRRDGHAVIYMDAEGYDAPIQFLNALNKELPISLAAATRGVGGLIADQINRLKKIDPLGGGIERDASKYETDWRALADKLFANYGQREIYIIVDEFSVFLDKALRKNHVEAENFLTLLRGWRQRGCKLKFLFAGSISLGAVVAGAQLSGAINDLTDKRVGALARAEAEEMIEFFLTLEQRAAAEGAVAYLCDQVGDLSPFFLNLLLDDALSQDNGPLSRDSIAAARTRLIANRTKFNHWHERLAKHPDETLRSVTLDILRHIAQQESGLTREKLSLLLRERHPNPDTRGSLIGAALTVLEEEGYLDPYHERLQFRSFLLRDYWKRTYGC